ncbi:MAG: TolC family protein [Acidobacteria bacterium]|nr:TolC family protein [Acidobacteriota bacterium]MCK6683018.1 TolC family protein [Thermoanaerobaculia bacterium]
MAMRTKTVALLLLLFLANPGPAFAADSQPTQAALPPLKELLAAVRQSAPSVRAARLRQSAAEAFVKQAGLPPNPSLEFRTENWRFDDSFSSHDDLDVVLALTQSIELGGKAGARRRLAGAGAELFLAERQKAEIAASLDATRLYLALIRVEDYLLTFADSREALDRIVAALTLRVAEGYSAETVLRKFEAEKALAEDRLVRGRAERREILAALQVTLGSGLPETVGVPAEPPCPGLPALTEEERRTRFLKLSPEVAAARSRKRQASSVFEGEKAKRVPNIDVTAGYKHTGGLDTAVAGVLATVPVFDSNAGALSRARYEEEAASLEVSLAENAEWLRLQSSWETAVELRNRAASIEKNLIDPARIVRDSARVAFEEGASDMLALLDAERVYSEARATALKLRHDAFLKTVEIRLLLGEEALP